MSESKFPVALILQGSARVDQMKMEIRSLISMVCGLVHFIAAPYETIIWEEGNRKWRVVFRNNGIQCVGFIRAGHDLFKWQLKEGDPRFYDGVNNVVDVYEHLQGFVDGMSAEFGSMVNERLKMFPAIVERFGPPTR